MNEAESVTPAPDQDALELTPEEARVLGALIEKALTTPEYYPLTNNALKAACNQKSNRDPATSYNDQTIEDALQGLRDKRLAVLVHTADGRVPRFRHTLEQRLSLTPAEVAVLCVLLLRGPQTPGEIRGRTGRMHEFGSLGEVQEALDSLMNATRPPAVCRLPRQAGRKEARFAHLLCGEVDVGAIEEAAEAATPRDTTGLAERVRRLEEDLADLREKYEGLIEQLGGTGTERGASDPAG